MLNHRKPKIKIGRRKRLVEDLLIVEGVSRAGKFVLANILGGFNKIEPVQYYGLLEHIPFLEKFGFIDKKTAEELIACEIDTHCYEMLIGRNLNHRRMDKSSIFNHPEHGKIIKRLNDSDGDLAVKKYFRNRPYSFFIMHELMPNIKIYIDTYPKIKILSLRKSPVNLVYAWLKRGLGTRYATDPKMFSIPIEAHAGMAPWFTSGWEDEYTRLKETDRIIKMIVKLSEMYEVEYNKLPQKYKEKILFVDWESLVMFPEKEVARVGKFLSRKATKHMPAIWKSVRIPDLKYRKQEPTKLTEIKKKASKEPFDILVAAEKKYWQGANKK